METGLFATSYFYTEIVPFAGNQPGQDHISSFFSNWFCGQNKILVYSQDDPHYLEPHLEPPWTYKQLHLNPF